MKGERKKIQIKQILAVSLACILLFSFIGIWAFSSILALPAYAAQIVSVEEGEASLDLTIYGDPESGRPMLEMFEYLEASDISWGTSTTDEMGNPVDAAVEMSELAFSRAEDVDQDPYTGAGDGSVENLDVHVDLGEMIDVDIQANLVEFEIEFWRLGNGLPAMNISAELSGEVSVYLYLAILPLPGMVTALYEFSGENFEINICVIKPLEIEIINPEDGSSIRGNRDVEVLVKTASPQVVVDNVNWWADGNEEWNKDCHFGGGMHPEGGDLWRSDETWHTHQCQNGQYGLGVQANGHQQGVQGSWFGDQEQINVLVDNPQLESWFHHQDSQWEQIHELPIHVNLPGDGEWDWQTWFSFSSDWIDVSFTAPADVQQWGWENSYLAYWMIGDTLEQEGGTTFVVDQGRMDMILNGEGPTLPLKCVYEQTQQPG